MNAIDREEAIRIIASYPGPVDKSVVRRLLMQMDEARPERLTDDDFETIRIHLNAYKEKLCNQQRWEEAEEYQRIIDRFMAFASAQTTQSNTSNALKSLDCIDRQDAIDALKDMYHAAEKWGEEASDDEIKARAESCMASLVEMKLRIEKLPSAQPERKKGKWILCTEEIEETFHTGSRCSVCNYWKPMGTWNFCPNCGADMRGE